MSDSRGYKPDWDDAPDWAQWLAQDSAGRWMWFSEEPPTLSYGNWLVRPGSGKWEAATIGEAPRMASGTLEQRPEHGPQPDGVLEFEAEAGAVYYTDWTYVTLHAEGPVTFDGGTRFHVTMTPVGPELKPCPFCGASGKSLGIMFKPDMHVWCFDCGARSEGYDGPDREANKAAAIAAWNRRPQ